VRSILAVLTNAVALSACGPTRAPLESPATMPTDDPKLQQLWRQLDEAEAESQPAPQISIGCPSHPAIDRWEDRLRAGGPDWATTIHGVARGARYLDRLRAILEEEGVPASLALLPVIESNFRPDALSSDGGRGLWQLQPRTARRFGLTVTARRDDRIDPEQSTRAAARYLRLLYTRYGDWPLALAAYNAGEGRVDKALRRAAGTSFWEAEPHLPRICREYVPRFLAVVRVVAAEPSC
jgi:hypothetical protein